MERRIWDALGSFFSAALQYGVKIIELCNLLCGSGPLIEM